MGIFLAITRTIQLKRMKSNIQWHVHLIASAMMVAAKSAQNLLSAGSDYESDTIPAKKLQERQYKLKLLEEELNIKKGQLEARLQMINEELKSCEQELKESINGAFSYNIG